MWVFDKLLCSHSEKKQKKKQRGWDLFLFIWSFMDYFLELFSFYFSCDWCDDLVGDKLYDSVRCTETCSNVYTCGIVRFGSV